MNDYEKANSVTEDNVENSNESETGKAKSGKFKAFIALLVILFLAGASYGGYRLWLSYQDYTVSAAYYENHFLPGTSFMGIDCSEMTAQEVEDIFEKEVEAYTLTITGRDAAKLVIVPEDISLETVFAKSFERYLSEQPEYQWMGASNTGSSYDISSNWTYSEEELSEILDNASFLKKSKMQEPEDAYLDFQDDCYFVVPEVIGNELDPDAVVERVKTAVTNLETVIDLETEDFYENPEVFYDDEHLNKTAEALNKYCSLEIIYEFGEETAAINGEFLKDYLTIDDNYQVTLDTTAFTTFVEQMQATYDTYKTTRSFLTSHGTTIDVPGGNYGWRMDFDATLAELLTAVEAMESCTLSPVYKQEAASYGDIDIGNTYVEIDLTSQYIWFYVDGKLIVGSEFVSGDVRKGMYTPEGTYFLAYKKRNSILRGDDYETPVSYWMPFNNGIGLHDAWWRSAFGGEVYLTKGSHGCINLPTAVAKTIFENIEAGCPIICYGGKQTYDGSTPKAATLYVSPTGQPFSVPGATTETPEETAPAEVPIEETTAETTAETQTDTTTDTSPTDTAPTETQPTDTQPADTQPAETQPTDTQPADTQPADTQPADTQPADTQPADTAPADTTSAEPAAS